jgi:hypothetical protein
MASTRKKAKNKSGWLRQPSRLATGKPGVSERLANALGETPGERAATIASLVAGGGGGAAKVATVVAAKKAAAKEAKRRAAILAKKRREASLTRAAQRKWQSGIIRSTKAANDPKYTKPSVQRGNTAAGKQQEEMYLWRDAQGEVKISNRPRESHRERNLRYGRRTPQRELDEGAIEQRARALKDKAAGRDAKGLLERAQGKVKSIRNRKLKAVQEKRLVKSAKNPKGVITKREWLDALRGRNGESTFKKGGLIKKSAAKKPSRKKSIDGIARKGHTRAKHR